ncbi:hypothetical protein D3C72_1760620 [compost metagenome]
MQVASFLHGVVKLPPSLYRTFVEGSPRHRQLHALGGAHEELQLQFIFKAAYALGQRGLADADAVGGTAHVAQAAHGQEIVQVFQSHDSAQLSGLKKR